MCMFTCVCARVYVHVYMCTTCLRYEVSWLSKLMYDLHFDSLQPGRLITFQMNMLPPSSGIIWNSPKHLWLLSIDQIALCQMLNYQNTCSQSNTNGSRYFVSTVVAFGFDTEAVRCSFWSVQKTAGRKRWFGAGYKKHKKSETPERGAGPSLCGEWIFCGSLSSLWCSCMPLTKHLKWSKTMCYQFVPHDLILKHLIFFTNYVSFRTVF